MDISLPLPPMALPDLRQTRLEVVLDMCAANGVDDIHISSRIAAREDDGRGRWKRMVGTKSLTSFTRPLHNHDAETRTGSSRSATRGQRALRVNRRCFESDLTIYCNINRVPMDGGHKSVAVGFVTTNLACASRAARRSGTVIHTWTRLRRSESQGDSSGQVAMSRLKVFHIETALNIGCSRTAYDILTRNEVNFHSPTA